MARRPNTDFAAWPALTLEGNLIAPAMIALVANQRPSEKEEATYGFRKGLTIRDEITLAFRVGQAHFDDFTKLASPSLPATTRFVSGLLTEAFGFDDIAQDTLPIAISAGTGRVPVVVVPPSGRFTELPMPPEIVSLLSMSNLHGNDVSERGESALPFWCGFGLRTATLIVQVKGNFPLLKALTRFNPSVMLKSRIERLFMMSIPQRR